MFGIADFGASVGATLLFLALPDSGAGLGKRLGAQ